MANSHSNTPSSSPQPKLQRRKPASRLDWNVPRREPRTPRAEWAPIMREFSSLICFEPNRPARG